MENSLRERKRARTRAAIIEAGATLIERDGYDATSIADIAAAAEIGTRTFFSYFDSKEQLLFPESDIRVQATMDAIASRGPSERPVDIVLRALTSVSGSSDEIVGRLTALRLRLIATVPAVRARSFQVQREAEREIAEGLREAFPGELDAVSAAALVGALIGAVAGALGVLLTDPELSALSPTERRARLLQATESALRPWRSMGE